MERQILQGVQLQLSRSNAPLWPSTPLAQGASRVPTDLLRNGVGHY